MSVNKLTYDGADYDDEIIVGSGGLDMSHAMVGETLAVDTLTVPVMTASKPVLFLASNQTAGDLLYTANGKIFCARKGAPTPKFRKNAAGLYYFDGDLVGKYYLNELNDTGPREHVLRFLSAIKLLDLSNHHGGLYTGETAAVVIADIIGDVAVYTIDDDVAAIQVYGYLPDARRRSNLQKVLMAITGALKNAADGSLRITQLSAVSAGTVNDARVFIGGQIVEKNAATAVQVTEHNYLETEETVELFNDSTITTETVIFKEPYHDLQITGGTIIESGANYCTFSASGAVVLTGKKYTHVTRVITIGKTPTDSDEDVVKIVSNNTLLTPNNAVTVAEKLFEYLKVSQSIKQEIVVSTERPGDVVSVYHPYLRQMVDACIKSMQIQFGKTELRAACEFLIGFIPTGATAGFEHYVVLTGSGTWTGPAGVTRIRAILAAAGDGGDGGACGEDSPGGTNANGGIGGTGSSGGSGGKIYEINLTVTPGFSAVYSCGTGGTGGSKGVNYFGTGASDDDLNTTPGTGASGTATTFDSISSDSGRYYPSGYYEPKSGLTLGKDGINGVAGARGNSYPNNPGPDVSFNGSTWTHGTDGVWQNGGGGAAVGSNGGNGATTPDGNGKYAAGDGADAVDGLDATGYGDGGNGGHGGGGGGYANTLQYATRANGGDGGDGGDGGAGVIVIYY